MKTKIKMPARTIKFECRYQASVADLWRLWTTPQGFESWWGPMGFRVDVRRLEAIVGGDLIYDMVAVAPEQISYLQNANLSVSHAVQAKFVEIVRHERIHLTHLIDFIPGVRPYENKMRVVFLAEADHAHMLIDIDEHVDQAWTQAATLGMQSQLTKVDAALNSARI